MILKIAGGGIGAAIPLSVAQAHERRCREHGRSHRKDRLLLEAGDRACSLRLVEEAVAEDLLPCFAGIRLRDVFFSLEDTERRYRL